MDKGRFFLPGKAPPKGADIMANENIPYKIYLNEDEMPRTWYNVRADMKVKPAPRMLAPSSKQQTTEAEK